MNRLKFSFARGARIQWRNEDVPGGWYTLDDEDPPLWTAGELYRVHPCDAHLEYGPLSSALRDDAIAMRPDDSSEVSAAKEFAEKYRDYLGWDWSTAYFEAKMFYLFCAEAMADEGL